MEKTIIVAEIGECFNGDLEAAKKMMLLTKEAECDFAKFQTLDYENISEDDPESDWFRKIAFTPERIAHLVRYAKDIKVNILFTPENKRTASWLLDAGLRDVKIASSLITDMGLIEFINGHFKQVFMSTGMASLDEVKRAVESLDAVEGLYIMHCVSEYPTGPLLEKRGLKSLSHEDVRFNMMKMLIEKFPNHKVGYSDHTSDILASIVAVALGAKVIEKHITLDRKIPIKNFKTGGVYLGTDHVLSLEPEELGEMVRQIREVEKMFGPTRWERSEGEEILRDFLRKRFVRKL